MVIALILIPALAGFIAFLLHSDIARRVVLLGAAATHTILTVTCWVVGMPEIHPGMWIALDDFGLLFVTISSVLFLIASVYAIGYLSREERGKRPDFEEGAIFDNAPEATFTGCMLVFLATMTLVAASQHFGILWIAIEATTLSTAPLIYFHRHHRSLEATWKYLLLCSVGIALALLGNFFLVVATSGSGASEGPFTLTQVLGRAEHLQMPWLRAAFVFFLVGYGTKMGLAPLHTWKPDVYSESPSVVAALLSGALSNCAFLGILRGYQICRAAGEGALAQDCLITFGLLSMGFAAVFVLHQADFKRMLAYSSVEHMGILALGIGLGGAATVGALMHTINHSISKALLFLVSGNILAIYKTKSNAHITGLLRVAPVSGILWIVGFLAISGSPPFGTFYSELAVLRGAIDQGRYVIAFLYVGLLAIVFIGMAGIVFKMGHGPSPSAELGEGRREAALAVLPPAILALMILWLGLSIPSSLMLKLQDMAHLLQSGS